MAGSSASNTLINIGNPMKVIAKMAAIHLSNNLVMANLVHRHPTSEFHKKGDEITIPKPTRYTVDDGPDISSQLQDTAQKSTTLKLSKHKVIGLEFGAKELALTPDDFLRDVLDDPIIKLANQVDSDILALYSDTNYTSGTAGTAPSSLNDLINVGTKMNKLSVPVPRRSMVLGPNSYGEVAKGMKGLFLPNYVGDVVKNAQLGMTAGFQVFMDQNVKNHTAGGAVNYVVDEPSGMAEGDIGMDMDTGSGTPVAGDVYTVSGCYAVNPVSYEVTDELMEFTVTGWNGSTLSFSPAVHSTGAYKNVDSLPADGGTITFKASHEANLAFNKNAFAFATAPFGDMDGFHNQSSYTKNGVTVTITTDGDIKTFRTVKRLDILYGTKTLYNDLAIRVLG